MLSRMSIALRELGRTGEQIPEIGLGTWQYRGGVEPLRRGIELGARFIDTAEIYGTESISGDAIADQHAFLATKVSGDHLTYDEVLKAAEHSLKRLGIPTIDLYQIHWPSERGAPIAETMRAMEELVQAGKVRYIGLSNFSRSQLEDAQAALKQNRIASNQVEYNLMRRSIEKDLPFYQREGITVIAYSPFARGDLLGSGRRKGLDDLGAVAAEAGKTPAQVCLNWCLSRPGVIPIPKTDRVDRVAEICGGSGWALTPAQVSRLDEAFS